MPTRLTHLIDDYVELRYANQLLFRYVYAPQLDPWESRKPYMHPVCTLAGNEVTCFRPHDHVWHKGVQMTMAHLSGQNFWGGFSYVRDQGYVKLDNVGRMQHERWEELSCGEANAVLRHRLKWITQAGEQWVDELREIRVSEIRPDEGYWAIDWRMTLKNVRGQELKFGSPTTQGRENAGVRRIVLARAAVVLERHDSCGGGAGRAADDG